MECFKIAFFFQICNIFSNFFIKFKTIKNAVPQILSGASNSRRMGWLRNISLDFWQRPLISFSVSCTFLPGFEPRTIKEGHFVIQTWSNNESAEDSYAVRKATLKMNSRMTNTLGLAYWFIQGYQCVKSLEKMKFPYFWQIFPRILQNFEETKRKQNIRSRIYLHHGYAKSIFNSCLQEVWRWCYPSWVSLPRLSLPLSACVSCLSVVSFLLPVELEPSFSSSKQLNWNWHKLEKKVIKGWWNHHDFDEQIWEIAVYPIGITNPKLIKTKWETKIETPVLVLIHCFTHTHDRFFSMRIHVFNCDRRAKKREMHKWISQNLTHNAPRKNDDLIRMEKISRKTANY